MPQKLLDLLTVALAAIVLRLLLIADQPYSDEGHYAAEAYVMYLFYTGSLATEGWLLPRDGILCLYPLLTSWVYFLPWEPLLKMRVLDAVVAAAASVAVYRFIADAMQDRWIALVSTMLFVLGANHPQFINAGYKNSIMLAYLLTALSLHCLRQTDARSSYFAGLLASAAVLFREFFFPMGFVVALYALARGGWPCFWRFASAGGALGVGVILAIMLLRGPGAFEGLITGYAEVGAQSGYAFTLERALTQGALAAEVMLPLLPLVIVGLLSPAFSGANRGRKTLELYLLGVALCLAPLVEVVQKPVHAYHYGQAILGLTILCALGCRVVFASTTVWYRSARRLPLAFVLAFAAVTGLLLLQYARTFYWQVDLAMRFVPVMIRGDWTSGVTDSSFYLRAARTIRENTSPSATLLIPFYARGLLPLTRRQPTSAAVGNLTRVLTRRNPRLRAIDMDRLSSMPPDVLVVIGRIDFQGRHYAHDYGFTQELKAKYSRRVYQPKGVTPYGSWSAEIFFR